MGAHFIVTDSGSGAADPVDPAFVATVKSQLSIPYFYAGGCRTADQARGLIKAGADGIQVGTAFEMDDKNEDEVKKKVESMVKAIKEAGREKAKASASKKALLKIPSLHFPNFKMHLRRWRKIKSSLGEKLEEVKERMDERKDMALEVKEYKRKEKKDYKSKDYKSR